MSESDQNDVQDGEESGKYKWKMGVLKQILLAGSLEDGNEEGFAISLFCGLSIAAPLVLFLLHSLPGRRGGFRSGSGENGVLTCKLANYVFFLGSGELPETRVPWARVSERD